MERGAERETDRQTEIETDREKDNKRQREERDCWGDGRAERGRGDRHTDRETETDRFIHLIHLASHNPLRETIDV